MTVIMLEEKVRLRRFVLRKFQEEETQNYEPFGKIFLLFVFMSSLLWNLYVLFISTTLFYNGGCFYGTYFYSHSTLLIPSHAVSFIYLCATKRNLHDVWIWGGGLGWFGLGWDWDGIEIEMDGEGERDEKRLRER